MSETTLHSIKARYSLNPTDRQFTSYTGHRINCLGRLPVKVKIGDVTRRLNLYVVSGNTDSLFGREWIANFKKQIDIGKLIDPNAALNSLLGGFASLFSDVPGKLTGPPASVHLKPDATPIFAKARDVPLALRDRYAGEIEKKLKSGL
uniref:Uncharacterized protein n=1 Tax=Anopheles epiroticus TaxID=199890 RepID=A0A182PWJ5_9DIPT